MSDFDNDESDEQAWGPVVPSLPYTPHVLDFIGIGLNGLAISIAGVGNGLHYVLQVSARECIMAAEGRRQRAMERQEQLRLEAYAATLADELKEL